MEPTKQDTPSKPIGGTTVVHKKSSVSMNKPEDALSLRKSLKSQSFDESKRAHSSSDGGRRKASEFKQLFSNHRAKDFKEKFMKARKEEWKDSYLNWDVLDNLLINIKRCFVSAEKEFSDMLASEVERVHDVYVRLINELSGQGFFKVEHSASDLALFIQEIEDFGVLNTEALKNILDRHDSMSKLQLRPAYIWKMQRDDFCEPALLEPLLLELSTLYHANAKKERASSSWDGAEVQKSEMQKISLWVPLNEVVKLTLQIMKNVPVTDPAQFAGQCSSVYFDDIDLSTYANRLDEKPYQLAGFKWRGQLSPDLPVSVERKSRLDDGSYKREGGVIPHGKIMSFIRMTPDDEVKEIMNNSVNLEGIQTQITDELLRPSLKIEYMRTTFEREDDPRIRLDLNTKVNMLRELDSVQLQKLADWTTPAHVVQEHSIHRFPFAILSVRHSLETLPEWLVNLVGSRRYNRVNQFSKYTHGTAVLYPDIVQKVPEWVSGQFAGLFTSHKKSQEDQPNRGAAYFRGSVSQATVSRKSYRDSRPMVGETRLRSGTDIYAPGRRMTRGSDFWRRSDVGSEMRMRQSHGDYGYHRESLWVDRGLIVPGRSLSTSINRSKNQASVRVGESKPAADPASTAAVPASVDAEPEAQPEPEPTPRSLLSYLFCVCLRDPESEESKKMMIRVEPKTFFANERTYMQWFNAAILMSSVGLALVGIGEEAQTISYFFMIISIFILVYSFYTFITRVDKLEKRLPTSRYADVKGPCFLSSFLILSFFIIIIISASRETSLARIKLKTKEVAMSTCVAPWMELGGQAKPTGITFDTETDTLWGVGSSKVFTMSAADLSSESFVPKSQQIHKGFQGITTRSPSTDLLYVVKHDNGQSSILEIQKKTRQVVDVLPLSSFNVSSTAGASAITYVPGSKGSGGYFYVGNAFDKKIYVYAANGASSAPALVETIAAIQGGSGNQHAIIIITIQTLHGMAPSLGFNSGRR